MCRVGVSLLWGNAPLCLGNSVMEHGPITVQPRGTRAKRMSACLCDDGWASLERWWMTRVAILVSYHAEWVTMAVLLLQWPLVDLCQNMRSAMTLSACWMPRTTSQSTNMLSFDWGKDFCESRIYWLVFSPFSWASKAAPTCKWLQSNVCFLLLNTKLQ